MTVNVVLRLEYGEVEVIGVRLERDRAKRLAANHANEFGAVLGPWDREGGTEYANAFRHDVTMFRYRIEAHPVGDLT